MTNSLKLMKSLDGEAGEEASAQNKARLVAGTSLLLAYTFAVTAAVAHFVVGERGAEYAFLPHPTPGWCTP